MNENQNQTSFPNSSASADFKVHTMPQKFLSMRPSFKAGKKSKRISSPVGLKKNLIIGIIIIVVIGGLMVLAAWFFIKSLNQPQTASEQTPTSAPAAGQKQPLSNLTSSYAEKQASTTLETLPSDDKSLLDFDSWLTFEQTDFEFTFNYPSSWQPIINSQPQPDQNVLKLVSFKDKNNTEILIIKVFQNFSQDLLAWIGQTQNIQTVELESSSFQNYSAYRYQNPANSSIILYVSSGQKIYSLSFLKSNDDVFGKVYEQILISFQFNQPSNRIEEQAPLVKPAADIDDDKLTDIEEGIYGTDKNKSDTDGDGYLDGEEVVNLYDPQTPGSSRLYDTQVVRTYINNNYNYNLIYPAVWQVRDAGSSVVFQDSGGEFIQVLIYTNQGSSVDIKDWYRAKISPDISELRDISVDGQTAVITPDGRQVYFLFGNNVYSLIYNVGLKLEANFMTTFNMTIKAFKLINSAH